MKQTSLQEDNQAPSVWVMRRVVPTYLRRMQSAPSRRRLHSSAASVIVSRGPKVYYYELPWIWASASGRPSGRALQEYDGSAPYIWVVGPCPLLRCTCPLQVKADSGPEWDPSAACHVLLLWGLLVIRLPCVQNVS